MKASDVFTPGRHPTLTFVDEHLRDHQQRLSDTLDAGSMLVSISGPSKSGKTVFVEQCLGIGNLIQVTGAGVQSPDQLWQRVFEIIGTPLETQETTTHTTGSDTGISGKVEGNAIIAKGEAGASQTWARGTSKSRVESRRHDALQLLLKELPNTELTVFIDDFHYIPRDVQTVLAQQIKEATRADIRIVCASVPYHADDVIRSNPDLRGRVLSIDLDFWSGNILRKIAEKGFPELNIEASDQAIEMFATEAAGSPQLMQYLCLNSCYELNVREKASNTVSLPKEDDLLSSICRRTVQSTDYGSVVEKMKEGPKTRGSDRKLHNTQFGWQGDVYRLLTKALSLDPPQLTFRYPSLTSRIEQTCASSIPSGSSITSACYHTANIINDTVGHRVVEWDGENDVFDVRDPYLVFFLRWSELTDG
ncbi:MAG: hypothetical protein ACPGYV_05355 [Phycisphaeraceae bacterium]